MPQGLSYVHKVHEPTKSVHKKHNSRRYEHPASGVAGPIGVGLCAIHPTSWKRNSRKFAVASSAGTVGLRGLDRGKAGFRLAVGYPLVASVARIRCERLRLATLRTSENYPSTRLGE